MFQSFREVKKTFLVHGPYRHKWWARGRGLLGRVKRFIIRTVRAATLSSDWWGGSTWEKDHALRSDGARSRGFGELPELREDTGLRAGMRGLQTAPGSAGVQDLTRALLPSSILEACSRIPPLSVWTSQVPKVLLNT